MSQVLADQVKHPPFECRHHHDGGSDDIVLGGGCKIREDPLL
jgi:hypothetical protein